MGLCQAPRTKVLCCELLKVFKGEKQGGWCWLQQSQREQDASGYWSNSRAKIIESLVGFFVMDSGFCSWWALAPKGAIGGLCVEKKHGLSYIFK